MGTATAGLLRATTLGMAPIATWQPWQMRKMTLTLAMGMSLLGQVNRLTRSSRAKVVPGPR